MGFSLVSQRRPEHRGVDEAGERGGGPGFTRAPRSQGFLQLLEAVGLMARAPSPCALRKLTPSRLKVGTEVPAPVVL